MRVRITPESPELAIENRNKARLASLMAWIWHILYILYCLEVGVFLLFIPWQSIWVNNYLVYRYPDIQPILANPYLKGGVVGLGIVNILIGIQEIARLGKNYKSPIPQ